MNTRPVIKIFTDGSCHNRNRTGAWAAVLFAGHEKKYLQGTAADTTHNRMELLAVIKSVDFATENYPGALMIVYTDSQYVERISGRMEKLQKHDFVTKKGLSLQNTDLIRQLIDRIETLDIRFIKVKAHQKSGELTADQRATVPHNIEADKLARKLLRLQKKNEDPEKA